MKHAELIARLDAAEVGDTRLSLDVLYAVVGESARKIDQHSVTTSLDAALALAERVLGAQAALDKLYDVCEVADNVELLPIDLCIAVLKALDKK